MGAPIITAILLAILAAAGWLAYYGWTLHSDVQIGSSGYLALALGTFFSLLVGCGLMALVFYSHRHGYDERAGGENEASRRNS